MPLLALQAFHVNIEFSKRQRTAEKQMGSQSRWESGHILYSCFLHLLWEAADPNPPLEELKGFLLAASWLGFPPKPLKKPPLLPPFPAPNRPPLEEDGC